MRYLPDRTEEVYSDRTVLTQKLQDGLRQIRTLRKDYEHVKTLQEDGFTVREEEYTPRFGSIIEQSPNGDEKVSKWGKDERYGSWEESWQTTTFPFMQSCTKTGKSVNGNSWYETWSQNANAKHCHKTGNNG